MICESCLHSFVIPIEKEFINEDNRKTVLQNENRMLEDDIRKAGARLRELKLDEKDEAKLRETLKELNEKEDNQKKELEELGNLQIECERYEEDFWEETLNFESKFFLLNEKKNSANKQIKEIESELEKLNRLNVLNDIIYISADHEVAKVNDLQLGRAANSSSVLHLIYQSLIRHR